LFRLNIISASIGCKLLSLNEHFTLSCSERLPWRQNVRPFNMLYFRQFNYRNNNIRTRQAL